MDKKDQHRSKRLVRAADLGGLVLAQVERTGEAGHDFRGDRLVALLVPNQAVPPIPQRSIVGTVEILGDVIEPVVPPEAWNAEIGRFN